MQLTLSQPALAEALGVVARAMASRNQHPSSIHLKAAGQHLHLLASDGTLSIQHLVQAEVQIEGALLVPGRDLLELVHRLPDRPLHLQARAQRLAIAWDDSEYLLPGLPAQDLPTPPQAEGKAVELPLATLVQETAFAVGQNPSRPWLGGIALGIAGDKATAMASDAAIAAFSEAPIHNPVGVACSLIIPGRTMQEVARLLAAGRTGTCLFSPGPRQVIFRLGQTTLASTLLDGSFPDVRQLLPDTYPARLQLARADLLAACERAQLAAENRAIRLLGTATGLQIEAATYSGAQLIERLAAPLQGEVFTSAVNVRYLLAGLRAMQTTQAWLEVSPRALRVRTDPAAVSFFAIAPVRLA